MLESFLSPFRCLRLLFSFSLWFASLNSISFRDKKENDFRKTPWPPSLCIFCMYGLPYKFIWTVEVLVHEWKWSTESLGGIQPHLLFATRHIFSLFALTGSFYHLHLSSNHFLHAQLQESRCGYNMKSCSKLLNIICSFLHACMHACIIIIIRFFI